MDFHNNYREISKGIYQHKDTKEYWVLTEIVDLKEATHKDKFLALLDYKWDYVPYTDGKKIENRIIMVSLRHIDVFDEQILISLHELRKQFTRHDSI